MQAMDLIQTGRIGEDLRIQQRHLKQLTERLQDVLTGMPHDETSEIVRKKLFLHMAGISRDVYDYQQMSNVLTYVQEHYDRTERQITDYAEEAGHVSVQSLITGMTVPRALYSLLR